MSDQPDLFDHRLTMCRASSPDEMRNFKKRQRGDALSTSLTLRVTVVRPQMSHFRPREVKVLRLSKEGKLEMWLIRRVRRLLKSTVLKAPFPCRHFELSLISSCDDDPATASDRLVDTALQSVAAAQRIQLPTVSARVPEPPYWPNVWPGEHYRLLAGIVQVTRPQLVIEIGTYTGLSALSMLKCLPGGSRLVTFDILPWNTIRHTHLVSEDFASGQMQQIIGDLADHQVFHKHLPLLQQADLIFVDGPKNITFEETFLRHLSAARLPRQPLLVFDDIRLWNMLRIWRAISKPKLDLTSFGHWSGTGIVDWRDDAPSAVIPRAA